MYLNNRFKKLFGDIGGDNSQKREKWVSKTLMSLKAGNNLLDVGAGEQRYRKYAEHLEYVSQDFSQYDGVGDGEGLHTGSWDCSKIDIVSDIVDMPLDDESFDNILCTEVLEHVPDPISAIKEMVRVLKPGGKLIMTAPFCSLTHFAPYHYYSGFNKYFFIKVLEEQSCVIDELAASGDWFDYISQEIRRIPSLVKNGTGRPIGIVDKLIMFLVLVKLYRFKNTKGLSETSQLLTYGYHVVASKKEQG